MAGALLGCQKESPPTRSPAPAPPDKRSKPFLVTTNDGIDHEFYRNVGLEEFLKRLPAGSVDSVEINLEDASPVFALVKVPEKPGVDLTRVRFETTFKTQAGQTIEKRRAAAKGRKAGAAIGFFCLPPSVSGGETRIVQNPD